MSGSVATGHGVLGKQACKNVTANNPCLQSLHTAYNLGKERLRTVIGKLSLHNTPETNQCFLFFLLCNLVDQTLPLSTDIIMFT